jgi:hypothetical protein
MGFFDTAKCFVGVHDWGEWQYKATGSCSQIRTCKRTGCTQNEIRDQHVFGMFAYGAENSCKQIRICTRCREKEDGVIRHSWGEWRYVSLDPWQQYITRLRKLRHILATRFDMGEVKEICFDLGIDIDDLPGGTKPDKARELIKNLELHHRVNELVQIASKKRTDLSWEEMEISGAIEGNLEEFHNKFRIDQVSWEFNPSESCNQIRECSRCGVNEKRNQHRWNGVIEFESPSSCAVATFCKRCGEKRDEGLKHKWGEWVVSTTECRESRICQRCGEREIGKDVPHNWGKWDFRSPVSCVLVRICTHCGMTEKNDKSLPHQWGEWNYESPVSCRIVRKCARCGISESDEVVKHKWSEWQYETVDSCKSVRTCQHCHARETGTAKHTWGDWEAVELSSQVKHSCKKCGHFEMSIAGVWTGIMNLKEAYFSDLYLEQVENSVKGILVLAYYNDELLTIVRQLVEGNIDAQKIDFSGTSYTFLKKGASKNYNLDRIVGEISKSGDKLNGKVQSSSSSGTIELRFSRALPYSQQNVSGLWDGMARWNNGHEDRWDLFIEDGSSILKGVLIVTVIRNEKVVSVVEQQVKGELLNNKISFKGASLKFIYDSGSKYSLDSFTGLIEDNGKVLKETLI